MNKTNSTLTTQTPLHSLQDFFLCFDVEESRKLLWDWLNITVSGSFGQEPVNVRQNLLTFYVHIQELLDATHALVTQNGQIIPPHESDQVNSKV
ncbi:hypothetical protein FW774_03685 (plasmid) [Pedobacter sp. BS3]|uniref:hypothetical protein n=1 Tax=Pedobacter sp. BS3 TaxID=2567937 RepID=UPI0011EE3609|nr:hypothetical protein [Pedobacter sp. BS3]TZF86161.1 hypothetical protein FW774_03685 [Pedobacter sp. BS3]